MGKFNSAEKNRFKKLDLIVEIVLGLAILAILGWTALGIIKEINSEQVKAPIPQGTITINNFTTPYFEDERGLYTRIKVEECWRVDWTEEEICNREIKKIYFD